MSNGPSRRDVVVAGHSGDQSTVERAVVDPDPGVREAALGALHRLHLLDATVLAAAFTDPQPAVRRRAAELAAEYPDVDLLPGLDDSDPTVVEVAAWACGEHEAATAAVLVRLVDLAASADDALVREAAAAALGAIGDPIGLPAILAACGDKPAVRRRAVLALAPFIADDPDGTVDAAIERALSDRDWQVRQAAEDLRRATAD